MKLIKFLMFFLASVFCVSSASGQANATLNILTQNSGQVSLGGIVDIRVTVGNTGPVSSIGVNKVRAQISVPIAIASPLPNAQQTGLPANWIITVNNPATGTITVCNGPDVIPPGTQREIYIKVQGTAVGGPSTINGSLLFSNGTSCTIPGTLAGDNTADNTGTTSIQVIATAPCNLGVSASAGTIACNGGTTTLTATPTGANGVVEYSITGGAPFQANNTFTVPAGTYTVTAREVSNNTCIATATAVSVTEPPVVTAPSAGTITQPTCTASTGSVVLSGLPSGNWTINPGGITGNNTTTTISGLAPGTYNFTVTNSAGCTSAASADVVINNVPATPGAPAVSVTQPTCTAATGTITITSATAGLTFSLDGGAYAVYPAGGYIAATGAHTLAAQNASGCISAVTNVTVNAQPATPAAPAAGTITQPTCAISTGSVVLNGLPSGNWTINPGAISGNTTLTTISGLAQGTYNFTVTNDQGCTSAASADVVINNLPGAPTAPEVSVAQPTCTVATGTITITSVTAGLTFSLDGGAYTAYPAGGYVVTTGTHTLTAQNAAICISPVTNVSVNAQPSTPAGPVVSIVTQPTCTVATGTITITSATTGLTFSLDGGAYAVYPAGGYIAAAGSHILAAQNTDGCISPVTNVTMNAQPATPVAPAAGTITQPTCAVTTGSVVLTGLPTGSWTINPGAISGNTPTTIISALTPGTYSFTVTNSAGCISAASADVVINNVTGVPAAPAVSVTQPACTVATGTITITSSTTGLTFSLDGGAYAAYPAGGYIAAAGSHTLTAQDAGACISAVTNITVNAQPATPAAPTVNVLQPTCTVSTGTITITSDTTGLMFSLDGGAYAVYPVGGFVITAGAHSLTAKNADGCISTVTNITVNAQPASPTASASAGTIACFGGTTTLTVTPSGGTPPFEYSMNSGAFQPGNTFIAGAGTYIFIVRDANLCTGTTGSVTVNQPTTISATASASASTIGCNGGTTTLIVSATGGTGTLQYSLNSGSFQSGNIFTVGAGSYIVTAKDANNCTAVTTAVTITQPTTLTASAAAGRITQCGGTTLVTVTASGGITPYASGVGNYIRGPGTWTFSITDAAGCTDTTEITIEAPGCMNLKVYPNPARNLINVNHTIAESGSTMQVFEINGALVISKPVPQNAFLTTIDVSILASGSYILVYWNGREKKTILFEKITSN